MCGNWVVSLTSSLKVRISSSRSLTRLHLKEFFNEKMSDERIVQLSVMFSVVLNVRNNQRNRPLFWLETTKLKINITISMGMHIISSTQFPSMSVRSRALLEIFEYLANYCACTQRLWSASTNTLENYSWIEEIVFLKFVRAFSSWICEPGFEYSLLLRLGL